MIFDTEQQRQIILELLNQATIPGKLLDVMMKFKTEVLIAGISIVEENKGNGDQKG